MVASEDDMVDLSSQAQPVRARRVAVKKTGAIPFSSCLFVFSIHYMSTLVIKTLVFLCTRAMLTGTQNRADPVFRYSIAPNEKKNSLRREK